MIKSQFNLLYSFMNLFNLLPCGQFWKVNCKSNIIKTLTLKACQDREEQIQRSA